ncbi:response regulator [Desulfobotulus sp. H1]|uniref:histidine kinase n=1 Tax=Desulfobotulus pelophilus TaxID=2823377 RepID=A0ABT3N540_9BACT|nr:response regulator [Desulfobotulus pelophilus]MCW7752565.1 response regulator [Desulfobotulus pelophilus]
MPAEGGLDDKKVSESGGTGFWRVFSVCALDLLSGRGPDLARALERLQMFTGSCGVSLWQVADSLEKGVVIQYLSGARRDGGPVEFAFPPAMNTDFMADMEKKCFCGHELPAVFCEAIGRAQDYYICLPLREGEFIRGDVSGFLVFSFERKSHGGMLAPVLLDLSRLFSLYVDRRSAFLSLEAGEQKYMDILESIEEGFFEIDLAGNLTLFNDAICRIAECSREELVGMNNREYTTPETAASMYRVFNTLYRTGRPVRIRDYEVILRDGRKKMIEISATLIRNGEGRAVGFRGLLRDVTEKARALEERRQLSLQLQQVQRMEAIGTLAGGIAHDFNNLLMGIQGNVSLMRSGKPESSVFFENLRNIEHCVDSGADLTRQLLGFARGGKYRMESLNVNYLIQSTATMFGRTRRQIRMQFLLADDLWAVAADEVQMEQVLLNLYVNAGQAMPSGGSLILATRNTYLDRETAGLLGLNAGSFVLVSVKDTGVGMDAATRQRIFEPFFTTREMGRGTGLGLASAFGIVKGHGGGIHVESHPGRGACFYLYLPALRDGRVEPKEEKRTLEQHCGIRGRILLVDDEEMVLLVTREMIAGMGCEVKAVASGTEALEYFAREGHVLDLVILDMIMPDISGRETYEAMKKICPHVKVLVSSGYSRDDQVEGMLASGCMDFIQKPYSMEVLQQALVKILCAGRDQQVCSPP